jgi:hypothetical protein
MFAQERVSLWRKKRAFAISQKEKERLGKDKRKAYDKSEYDGWSERIRINDNYEVATELIGRLSEAVQSNPYPGERKRVLTIAVSLIPEGGKGGWRVILQDPDFNFPPNFANERITFPALVSVSVLDIEKKLWELVREDNTISASEVPRALNMGANSKAYREVKTSLEQRNWRWGQRRIHGKMEKVVFAPSR